MCHNKIDMVVLVDGSGSVTKDQFKIGKKFVADLVKHFDISKEKTNVAMASYSQYTHTGRTFNDKTSPESVLKAVDKLPYEGAASRFDFGMDHVESEFFNAKSGARTNSEGENHTEHCSTSYHIFEETLSRKKYKLYTIRHSVFLGNSQTNTNLHSYRPCTCFKTV